MRREQIFPLAARTLLWGLASRHDHLMPDRGLRRLVERHVQFERLEHAAIELHVLAKNLYVQRLAERRVEYAPVLRERRTGSVVLERFRAVPFLDEHEPVVCLVRGEPLGAEFFGVHASGLSPERRPDLLPPLRHDLHAGDNDEFILAWHLPPPSLDEHASVDGSVMPVM